MISERLANICLVVSIALLALTWTVESVVLLIQAVAALVIAGLLVGQARANRGPRHSRRR